MKFDFFKICSLFFLLGSGSLVKAQDPKLPPTNLGQINMLDGKAPGPGIYYQQVVQTYSSSQVADGNGQLMSSSFSSILAAQQLLFTTKLKVAGANLGFMALQPLVQINAGDGSLSPMVNANPMGDLIVGSYLQWYDKKFLSMPFYHRFELDVSLPTGSFSSDFDINPGANRYVVSPHYTFTAFPTKLLSFSMRHYLNYNFREIGSQSRAGISYNFNYSLEHTVYKSFRIMAAGYFLDQLENDRFAGNSNYYSQVYGIDNTREKAFAIGLGLGYITPTGLSIEVKSMKETTAVNRSKGTRSTLVLAYRIGSK
ncbi:transporter [Pedobacter aquatilis]|uniref:SphA family protein n=1 Tax=Pedobacter aquatilis TaxID=351343 RepID=UPI00292CA904|nr:transporter [Pedobacter aquatilis]